jgi:lipopolysaccharide transport system permease protein/teichoic acid transport system permease protein
MAVRLAADFAGVLVRRRHLLAELTRKEFKSRYLGSYLGVVWVILQPIVTVLILWFVFAVGFRTKPAGAEFPYVLWMLAGIVPWFFLNDAVTTGAAAILDNSFLVKRISFRLSLLPFVRALAALMAGLILLALLLAVLTLSGHPPGLHGLQVAYYLVAGLALVSGLSLVTSTLSVFVRDVVPMTAIAMQFFFWLSAVFWPLQILPGRFRFLIRLNPFSYIVEGFRDALIYRRWFWQDHLLQTAYFWLVVLAVSWLGLTLYRRGRPVFADHL